VSGKRKALIVANDEYEQEGLRHLLAPAADAEALGRVLGDRQIGDFAVQVVRNEPAHVIQAQIEELFTESRSEDVLLLHFSCHGLKSESGELFFAAANTRPNRLGSTAISADFVQRCMRSSRSRSIVLLLDCCYGGAFAKGVTVRAAGDVNVLDSFPQDRLGGGRGRAVITASSAMEYAFEGDQLADDHSPRPSVFTTALVEGLATGEADRDQDGWVSLNELYDYVFDKVRERNPHQTPSRDVEMQGDLYIARRSRPVTTPAPLPPELQQAIDHPLAGIRAGAVQELVRVLQARHAGLALAARLALEHLAEDDSRAVSAAAAAVLSAGAQPAAPARPTPPRLALSATSIDFGRLSLHAPAPERRVRLGNAGGGTLNARAATQASWLNLQQAGDELIIVADTGVAGEHDSIVSVDSDGGSATIRVRARTEPAPQPGPQAPAAAHPPAVPAAPERERPGPQPETALTQGSPAPPDTAPPVTLTASVPATPASGAVSRPAVGPASLPVGADLHAAAPARDDRRLLIAGGLAIAGSALKVVGLFPAYTKYISLAGLSFTWLQAVIAAAVTLTAGVCMLIPRTRRLIGPGLLLGTVPASAWGLVSLASAGLGLNGYAGFWLQAAANLILVLAACLAGLALGCAAEVSLERRSARGALPRAVALLGITGALALVFLDYNLWAAAGGLLAPSIWATVMAVLVPACAAAALPRRFGVSLLASWIGCAASIVVYESLLPSYVSQGANISSPNVAFGITLLALMVVAVPFARNTPIPEAGRAAQD
jgi:Caspase domain